MGRWIFTSIMGRRRSAPRQGVAFRLSAFQCAAQPPTPCGATPPARRNELDRAHQSPGWVSPSWMKIPNSASAATYEYESDNGRRGQSSRPARIERRGRALLLVDETVARPLASELEHCARTWSGMLDVQRNNVPRHEDNAWSGTPSIPVHSDVCRVKSLIQGRLRGRARRAHAAFLIGHVTSPTAGGAYEDAIST